MIFIGGVLGGSTFAVLNGLLNPGLRLGVLGRHDFALGDSGLYEKTDFNESLHSWHSLDKIVDAFGLVLLRVAGSSWHIIPERSFSGPSEKQQFLEALRARVLSGGGTSV